jgi:hypothetical protein
MNLDRETRYWLVAVLFSTTGFGLALMSAAILARGYDAQGWSETTGQVVRSNVEVSQKAAGIRRPGRTVFDDYYTAKIEYEYVVDGKKYVSDEIVLADGQESFDRSVAEAAVNKYSVGREVTIYYNPNHPDRALIERDFGFGIWWTALAFAVVEGLAGVVIWVKAARISAANRPATASTGAGPRSASASRATKPRRPTHLAIRSFYTVFGLAALLLGSLVLVSTFTQGPPPGTDVTSCAVMQAMMAGLVGVGGVLIRKGMQVGGRAAT